MSEQLLATQEHTHQPTRPLREALWRGFKCTCPSCGSSRLFSSFLTTVDRCEHCSEEMHHHRADDLPAYLVILVVGHLVVGAFMGVEAATNLSHWQHLAIWVPITILGAVVLLRPTKGAVVGLQWALYMHGFDGNDEQLESHPEAEQDQP